jgi:DNA-binding NarL/FixJ family response regulator
MKVLLVDDHPLILASLQSIIQTLDEAVAVVTADNPEDAFSLLATDTDVDLVLLDLGLGVGVDGFAVLADLRERYPALPVVVVSATEQLTDMVRAVDMGAMGFVPKRTPNPELFEALGLVLSGGVFIPPALLGLVRLPGMSMADAAVAADAATARKLAGQGAGPPAWQVPVAATASPSVFQALPGAAAATPSQPLSSGRGVLPRSGAAALGLTPRQADVLELLLKGLPNKLIARELNVSVDTIKDHVAAVLRALGVNSRTQAVLVVSQMTHQAAGLQG